MTIGENIQRIRKEKKITQKQLAELSYVATGTIQQYELGKRQPRIEQLRKIAAALELTISDFIDDWSVFSKDEIANDWDNSIKTQEERSLLDNYRILNKDGQTEAQKRVVELTEITRYTNSEDKSE